MKYGWILPLLLMIGCAQEKSVSVTFEVDGMDVRNGFL